MQVKVERACNVHVKVELVVLKPERFFPDSLWPCQHVCLRIVQPVGVLGLGPLLSINAF